MLYGSFVKDVIARSRICSRSDRCLERFRLDFDDAYQYYTAYITMRAAIKGLTPKRTEGWSIVMKCIPLNHKITPVT